MIVFPNAKINLGLKIRSRLADGFHSIETVMIPVGLKDVLEIVPSKSPEIRFRTTGIEVAGSATDNLSFRAARLMQQRFGLPGMKIHLHKSIPSGAGLGGGSSDAAFTLSLINRIFALDIAADMLETLAFSLGSDCPFFIRNTPALATGKGENLTPVTLPALQKMTVLIVKPALHIATAMAYQRVSPDPSPPALAAVIDEDVSLWKTNLVNDFEPALVPLFPEIDKIKKQLYALGAIYASLSGSGAAVYGLFVGPVADFGDIFKDCFLWQGGLLSI